MFYITKICEFHKGKIPKLASKMTVSYVNKAPSFANLFVFNAIQILKHPDAYLTILIILPTTPFIYF
jgi:hypothetical protein